MLTRITQIAWLIENSSYIRNFFSTVWRSASFIPINVLKNTVIVEAVTAC